MPVSSARGPRRIAVGDEGRRTNYRTATFSAMKDHGSITSQPSTKKPFSYKPIANGVIWFMKQISPGILLVAFFFIFRNLNRRTQLQLMKYSKGLVIPEFQAVNPSLVTPQPEPLAVPRFRLGAHVPTALENLADMSTLYNPKTETAYFWDIHFAGETVAEAVFTKCHFLIQACEHGLKQPEYNDEKLEVFETPSGALYVNVDTSTKSGIRRAQELGLAEQRLAEVMMSPELHLFARNIFTQTHKGRLFALFRNPIHRAVSMYHYLSTASWDPLYNPQLRIMTVEEYAQSSSVEHNWMTRFLVNKPGGQLNKQDMIAAKEILRTKCLIGMYDDMEASLQRFQLYFGWSQKSSQDQVQECRKAVVAAGDPRHKTPEPDPGTSAYNALARVNKFDMELYEYAKVLYRIQGEQIFGLVFADPS